MRVFALAWLLTIPLRAADSGSYDPLKVPDPVIRSQAFEMRDEKRDRTLPVRVYLPEKTTPSPVVLFSHGLGGSRDNNPYLGNHWAKRGYVVVFLQHPGSDEGVWKTLPPSQRTAAMKQAASMENLLARAEDVPVVIDVLIRWNLESGHPLHGRLDMERVGMSGHSFGARTTQGAAGQGLAGNQSRYLEPRIDAAVMMSPSPPSLGSPDRVFAPINIPCLLMTGTLDDSPIGNQTAAERLKVFPALTNAPAWQVVLDKATHMSFGSRAPVPETRHHRAILALTTAFWDACLKQNPAAKAWLNGSGARTVLMPEDTWEINANALKR